MGVNIMLGNECITPGRRSRMAADLDDHFGPSRDGKLLLDHDDIPALAKLAICGGLHEGEDSAWRDQEISTAYLAIIKEIHASCLARVRLLY
jgi:hypothetical protein